MGLWDYIGSRHLENTGSVARDHLANERTYLAWLRTALAFASIGVAIVQLFRLSLTRTDQRDEDKEIVIDFSTAIGGLFICGAVIVTVQGIHRYFTVQHHLQHNKFPAARGNVLFLFILAFSLIVITFGFLLYLSR